MSIVYNFVIETMIRIIKKMELDTDIWYIIQYITLKTA